MSRIFDALQRSEQERSGTDSPAPPEGPELLRRAERQATTEWSQVIGEESTDLAGMNGAKPLREAISAFAESPAEPEPLNLENLRTEKPQLALDHISSLPISLSEQSRLVCLTDKENATAEALRLLAVRLRDLRRTRQLKKVMITSTIPQEGKSTIAGNLACALAHATQERILLVEGDLRRPSLSRMFGIRTKTGICETLRGDGPALQNISQLKEANLWIS